jgi:hypothetical protein
LGLARQKKTLQKKKWRGRNDNGKKASVAKVRTGMKTYSSRERKRKDRGRRKKVRERERGTEERERERRRLDPVCRAAGKHKIYNLSFRCDMRFANL